ncbi:bifunctional glycosyltransferase/CDP-glycerol:glycerophosphate glycerophosphotransferase [Geodermatophilus marinus]|uniref:bifunctional glycosyltransferase/CDP-glycerol:glycerophosphate glycerophosphotransferase n=1 Tax=Geodermatophilus sp. LHW52908 TaxID=2303986 RepID=UPI002105A934|nr:CDP-glycerol glycerophosphotransferase family protein [Geodermatophilus sp. LHW52908]
MISSAVRGAWSRRRATVRRALVLSARGLGGAPLTRAPRVSIVVPVYNVEPYLAACLRSISAQTYRNIEVVVVDDGSTDGSLAVARRARRRDRRIRIVTQPNGGLSSARNSGTAAATGEYLAFVDSDDRIDRRAVATVMRSLRSTGSDFAVMSYRRMNNEKTWPAGPWIRELHSVERQRCTLEELPSVLVNAVAWSKVYRRSFWDEAGLRFQEGVLYEDQAVSAEAYAKATTFDVLPDVLYDWRVREDRSSISQQVATENDLRERFGAAFASLQALRQYASPQVLHERSRQLLANDFRLSLAQIDSAGDDFWKILVDGVRQLFDMAPDDVWPDIYAQARALYHLVLRDDRPRAERYLEAKGLTITAHPTAVEDGRVTVQLPLHDDPGAEWPAGWNELGPSQTPLVTAVRRAWWSSDRVVEIRGWAHVATLDLARYGRSIEMSLRSADGRVVPLEVRSWPDPDIARVSGHQWADVSDGGFAVSVDVTTLPSLDAGETTTWQLWARVETAGVVREAPVGGVNRWSSAGQLPARDLGEVGRTSQRIDAQGVFCLHTHRPLVRVLGARGQGDRVTLELATQDGAPLDEVTATRKGVSVPGRGGPWVDGRTTVTFVLPRREGQPRYWSLRSRRGAGTHTLGWGGLPPEPRGLTEAGGVQLRRTRAGNVTLIQGGTVVDVTEWRVSGDRLLVSGRTSTQDQLAVAWKTDNEEIPGAVERTPDGFVVSLPLTADPWGHGARPLPEGRYTLVARTVNRRDPSRTSPTALELSDDAVAQFPLPVRTPQLRARLERSPKGAVTLIVIPPRADDELGARNQRRLQESHRTADLAPRRDAVLFRSFYGENTSCNGLGVHRELVRRGTDLTLHWVVKDHSVPVPEGGVPVLRDSREFYELLGSARYVFDNVHQPDYTTKRDGQVFVQTFHGYPFKLMGRPYWAKSGYARHRVESFDRRMRDWDYVVSPARYATPLLRDAFGVEGEMLEIGYPRNDVLLDDRAEQASARTRAALGIADHQQVVLYAPTYRDNLSTSEFRSRMVDFLDVKQFSRAVGPDTVLLVRGHAMNARVAGRTARSGNVIDVTDHPEITDLVLASDAAVLDYSSLRFDYALTGKPMVFLVPDLDLYKDKARGWLFDYEPTAPGPLVSTTAEVVAAVSDLRSLASRTAAAREEFRARYLDLEDGRASQRLVDAVMAPRGDA